MAAWKRRWMTSFAWLSPCLLLACTTRPAATEPGRPQASAAEAPRCVDEGDVPPESIVRALYRTYLPAEAPGLGNEPREILSKYFDAGLTELFIKDQECRRRYQGICDLNSDVLVGANFVEVSNLWLCVRRTSRTEVVARFLNGGRETVVTFDVQQIGGAWKVVDIRCGDESLRSALQRQAERYLEPH